VRRIRVEKTSPEVPWLIGLIQLGLKIKIPLWGRGKGDLQGLLKALSSYSPCPVQGKRVRVRGEKKEILATSI